jgi:ABC-2 type transport system permease protein
MRRVLAQARVELSLTLRNGENLLATMAIPLGILVFFTLVDVLPHPDGTAADQLVPAVMALAIVSTGLVALSIATAFERQLGVLRRLGVTPLGRGGLLAAKSLSVLVVEAIQLVAIALVGLALGWRPLFSVPTAAAAVLVGTAAFTGIGFLLAGTLRAEANLGVANALFIGLMLFGGVVVPASRLPGPLAAVAKTLPVAPLVEALRLSVSFGLGAPGSLLLLGAWAIVGCSLAATTFRWD